VNYPECFSSKKQFLEWKRLARASNLISRASVCVDCTPEYKTRMMQEDRCSEPEVYFHHVNGELVGDFPQDRLRSMDRGAYSWGSGKQLFMMKSGG